MWIKIFLFASFSFAFHLATRIRKFHLEVFSRRALSFSLWSGFGPLSYCIIFSRILLTHICETFMTDRNKGRTESHLRNSRPLNETTGKRRKYLHTIEMNSKAMKASHCRRTKKTHKLRGLAR